MASCPWSVSRAERSGNIDTRGLVSLYWDKDQHIDPATLDASHSSKKSEVWSEETVGPVDPFDGVWLRLTATEPGTCRIAVEKEAKDSGLCTPAITSRSPALVEDSSFAYLAIRRTTPAADGQSRHELGALGHGPEGKHLAHRLCGHIHAWSLSRDFTPAITAFPAGTGDTRMPDRAMVIDKVATRLALEV